jgi:hypothetical protein
MGSNLIYCCKASGTAHEQPNNTKVTTMGASIEDSYEDHLTTEPKAFPDMLCSDQYFTGNPLTTRGENDKDSKIFTSEARVPHSQGNKRGQAVISI